MVKKKELWAGRSIYKWLQMNVLINHVATWNVSANLVWEKGRVPYFDGERIKQMMLAQVFFGQVLMLWS